MTTTKAVRVSVLHHDVRREAFAEASRFRGEFYECLTAQRDELLELTDALLCVEGPVVSPVWWPSTAVGTERCTEPSTTAGSTSSGCGRC